MPALAKPPAVLPRHLPHGSKEADAGAGAFSNAKSQQKPQVESKTHSKSPSGLDNLDRLAHDARNILSGLTLYCELLAAPGVLTKPHAHYAQDLESIARSTAQIVDRILEKIIERVPSAASKAVAFPVLAPAAVIDAAEELRHLQPLLAAIAGPGIRLSVATIPCPGRTALAVEDLTRILVNLVRNAADAMPAGGHIRVTAQHADGPRSLDSSSLDCSFLDSGYAPRSVVLTVADDGPGIPEPLRGQIFDPGFTTRTSPEPTTTAWPTPRPRGLGLSIVRHLVEAAGGTVRAAPAQARGVLFEIILPLCDSVTSGTYAMPPGTPFPADSRVEGCIECQ